MCFGDNISFQLLDKGCIERFGPLGISQFSLTAANQISFMHSGLIFHYLFMFILGAIGMTLFFMIITALYWIIRTNGVKGLMCKSGVWGDLGPAVPNCTYNI